MEIVAEKPGSREMKAAWTLEQGLTRDITKFQTASISLLPLI